MKANTSSIALLFGLLGGCAQPITATSGGSFVPPGGAGSFIGGGQGPTPSASFGQFNEPVVRADSPPPPVSGGTLAVVAEGHLAAVSDPDRDQIVVVDLDAVRVSSRFALEKGDEPGRIVEDGAGHVHIALRGSGAVITLDARTGTLLERRSVCMHPRGLAYDKARDLVHVACAGGQLISLPAAGGPPVRQVMLDRDLRDVVVDGDRLLVSRFRAAEMLIVEADGHVSSRLRPPPVALQPQRFDVSSGQSLGMTEFEPAVAWRMTANPDGGALLAFQEEQMTEVQTSTGGYGGGCGSIVRAGVARLGADGASWTVAGLPVVLPVDLAVAPGGVIDVISASTPGSAGGVFGNASVASVARPSSSDPVDASPCGGLPGAIISQSEGIGGSLGLDAQLVAIAYDRKGRRILQSREPYLLVVGQEAVTLPGESRRDTGHDIFHFGTGGGVACASCHPEGREDGHVWQFAAIGPRRTQSIGGGVLGTEPFHWGGDMKDFPMLAHDVFSNRMSGPNLEGIHVDVLSRYVDQIPPFKPDQVLDSASVDRGRALFQSSAIGCASCHSGAKMTNNASVDVGTGSALQVPSLIGVGWRAPYLHSGCAPTLEARFGGCGGGELHGHTSGLSPSDRSDLVSYLQSL